MTELTIPRLDDPSTIAAQKYFSTPFSEENLSFPVAEADYFIPEEEITITIPGSSFSEWNISLPLPEITLSKEDATPSPTESSLPEEAEEAIEIIYHFLLEDAPSGNYTYRAINQLQTQLSAALIANGYYGVSVSVDPDQIDVETGEDYRRKGDNSLNLRVLLGEVVKQRTIAKGGRFRGDAPVNHPLHKNIIKNSPFGQYADGDHFLIDKKRLDNYVQRLNGSSRRRVDVSLASAGNPKDVVLDYIVSEAKPWTAYFQVSNTGTEATGEWRERMGVVHHQLTNNDDILALDYLTAEFDRANAVLASYTYPLVRPNYLTLQTYFTYSDFAARNLEVSTIPDSVGETISFGMELANVPFYWQDYTIAAIFGFLYEDIDFETSGLDPVNVILFSPYLRLEAFKRRQLYSTSFSISYEENIDTRDDDENELVRIGRLESTVDHRIMRFDLYHSFFIEPLLSSYYEVKPEKWLANSLVHEIAFSLSGQQTFDGARLITQKQVFGGGFFTVRGYNESASRGDSGLLGSVEYRVHLARLLKPASLLEEINSETEVSERQVRNRFNYRAPSLYGIPDWNFLVRGFFDWASFSFNGDAPSDEIDQDLRSAGVGFEFQYKSNLNLRLDFGVVLEELIDFSGEVIDDADQGDSRFHFLATFSF